MAIYVIFELFLACARLRGHAEMDLRRDGATYGKNCAEASARTM